MGQFRTILLIADSNMQRSAAFEEAAWLAAATNAALHILFFDHDQLIESVGRLDKNAMAHARDAVLYQDKIRLEQEAGILRGRGLRVTTEVQWSRRPCNEILIHVRELNADLVIKAVHREPLLKRILYAPLDRQLLLRCPAPLLLVSGVVRSAPKRIIAAVDPIGDEAEGHAMSDTIIRAALTLALQCSAEVHLVNVFGPPPEAVSQSSSALALINSEIYTELRAIHRKAFTELANTHGVPLDRRHFLPGMAAPVIAEFSMENDDDVIVLGFTQRTRLDRLFMGTTAEHILEQAPCNVLVVKPDNFASAAD